MNKDLLGKYIHEFIKDAKNNPKKFDNDLKERQALIIYYQYFTRDIILKMTKEEIYEYMSSLWAMLIWGNKHYVVDKLIEVNKLENFRTYLAELVWGKGEVIERWDNFRSHIKGMGPAMISEILCKTHPNDFMLWNRRAYVGLNHLEVKNLPRHDYQVTGKVYKYLCDVCKEISKEFTNAGINDPTLLAVDYFIWDKLQVEENLSKIYTTKSEIEIKKETESFEKSPFSHNDIRDKLRDIGQLLGFTSNIEQKVSEGSVVDTILEATIGNMGKVIYVFEVQTKGNIDGLIINLLKSLNNPAVQGVVAVSDGKQLDIIKKHVSGVRDLRDKLIYWDYEEIIKVYDNLQFAMERINKLGLVPQSF
ncbi:MAG: hypothetical protein WBW55_14375 [Desulfobaccales bacterium]